MNSLGSVLSIFLTTLLPHLVTPLANCPHTCDCNDETLIVTCGNGDLDVLPIALNPSLQRLIIKNNKIRRIDSEIQFYAELRYVDLSYNHLFSIPTGTFTYQKKLTELHLNHNKIGTISTRTFSGLESLTILNLNGNFLDELNNKVFQMLTKLEELNLGQNRIAKIELEAFDGLKNLRVLYLDDNNLNTVDGKMFAPLTNLAELYLGTNSFTSIPRNAFGELKGLQRLDLRGAALANITTGALKGLDGIRTLDLTDNRLVRIPTDELRHLTRLEELYLSQNEFEVVHNGALEGIVNLRELKIEGSSKLKRIESGAFSENGNLESITIASNIALNDIQDGVFNGLTHLKSVVLKGNALTTLSEGRFAWNELQMLDISDNPINCDCRVLWLRNVLVGRNTTQNEPSVNCVAPERLRGKNLAEITSDLPGCFTTDPKRQALIGALLVGIAAVATMLALLIFRCRKRIWESVKGGFGSGPKKRKEREYQKTFSDEEYMARHPHPCLNVHTTMNNYQANHPHHGLHAARGVPVTEL